MNERLVKMLEDGQRSIPSLIFDLREFLISTMDDFQKVVDLIVKYDWDFDNYLEEDILVVMEYIQNQSNPNDGNLFSLGHSMGGIFLYAHPPYSSRTLYESGLASVVTLGSSLNYIVSNSSLKLFLPLTDPTHTLNVCIFPIGTLMETLIHSHHNLLMLWL
jgi:hypothetical protein